MAWTGERMRGWMLAVGVALALMLLCADAHPAQAAAAVPAPRQAGGSPAPVATSGIDVAVDPRVELVTVLARLAGLPEYQAAGIADYDAAVDAHFAPYRDHASVATMRRLARERHIGFNAPIELALLATPGTWAPAVPLSPLPDFLDPRWDPASAHDFLDAARRFERDTGAEAFFASQRPLYDAVEAAVRANLAGRLETAWYGAQMPRRGAVRFRVVPALLAGANNYGPHIRHADGGMEVYGVLGTPTHRAGERIQYPADAQLSLLVHEFHHPYMNPWADAHADVLLPPATALFDAVQARMRELAYGEPRILLYESLVRANTLRYLRAHGEDATWRRLMAEDRAKGFPWTPALADLLDARAAQAPPFDAANEQATTRAVAALLTEWGRDHGTKVAAEARRLAEEERARLAAGPQVRLMPADGAVVDATQVSWLELHFDRPMAPGIAIYGDPPRITGKPAWDEARRVLRIPVALAPGASYRLSLNNEEAGGFRSADGEVLAPRTWHFTARPAP